MLLRGISAISAVTAVIAAIYAKNMLFAPIFFVCSSIVLLLLWAVICVICAAFVDAKKPCERYSRIFGFFSKCITDSLLQIYRVRLHITGLEKLPKEKFLLVGNHRSAFDPIIEMNVFHRYHMGFMAKQELFNIPIIGKIMHKNFCLPLERNNPRSDIAAVIRAVKLIKSQTASVGVYPEGKRNTGNELLPFKNGAFKIAQKSGCHIAVVIIRGSELITKPAPFTGYDVYLDIAKVLESSELARLNTAEISDMVREIMVGLHDKKN